MVPHVSPQSNRLEITRARPGQPAGGVTLVDSRGLHAFCAPPHTSLVLVYHTFLSQLYRYSSYFWSVLVLQIYLKGIRCYGPGRPCCQ